MAKLFDEIDEWESLDASSSTLSFKKIDTKIKSAEQKEEITKDRKRKRKEAITLAMSVAGKFVKAPIYDDPMPTLKTKPKKSKNNQKTVEEQNEVPNKKVKKGHHVELKPNEAVSFQDKLKNNLLGSRFRYLNEKMYKSKGEEAYKLFQEDGSAFEAYHEGYRHQISQWPMNPLDRIINNIKRLPKNYVIADFGCGDARLAKSVLQKVYSLDLVAAAEDILECDMSKTPLESKSINVVVYCLSLMGTNLKDFFVEANRILKIGGLIKIAEVSSRFDNINEFVNFVQICGFELVSKDLTQNLFYFINFKKTYDVNEFNKKVPDFSLKPCIYKKR